MKRIVFTGDDAPGMQVWAQDVLNEEGVPFTVVDEETLDLEMFAHDGINILRRRAGPLPVRFDVIEL